MRLAVISDVHGNLDALEAVASHIAAGPPVDAVINAGDAVGYGPYPSECVEMITSMCLVSVAGNHDHGVLGLTDISTFNPIAVSAIEWTRENISQVASEIIGSWPMTRTMESPEALVVHANPVAPELWDYIISGRQMQVSFEHFTEHICIVGHSHIPFVTEMEAEGRMSPYGKGPGKVFYKPEARYLVNAGSVGQPRDQDPRASYVLIDDEGIEVIRVEYDVAAAAQKFLDRGLHVALSERIRYGF